jgi:hypothetical protein
MFKLFRPKSSVCLFKVLGFCYLAWGAAISPTHAAQEVSHIDELAASGEFFEDILERMSEADRLMIGQSAFQLKTAGSNAFYQVNGYRAKVLSSFCKELYQGYTGQFPPAISSGYSGVVRGKAVRLNLSRRPTLAQTNAAIASRCQQSILIESLLNEYWPWTAMQVEAYLVRAAKLINLYHGVPEVVLFGDELHRTRTMNLENALGAKSDQAAFLNALKLDTQAVELRIFGNLNAILSGVQGRVEQLNAYRELLSDESSLEAVAAQSVHAFHQVDGL